MQLKRVTEYALRYLICLAKTQASDREQYITLSEMNVKAKLTGKPRPSETRKLFDSDWIDSVKCGKQVGYRLAVDADLISVYDAVCLIENTTNMRAVFFNDGFTAPEEMNYWASLQDSLDDQMKAMTLAHLASMHDFG